MPCLLVFVLTVLVYANGVSHEFTNWDDPTLVVNNATIRSLSARNIIDIFTPRAGSTYQPVRTLSYAIDYHFWKLDPVGYHLVNIVLHALTSALLIPLVATIVRQIARKTDNKAVRRCAIFAACLFAVHPINVESVAWISSRKYVLAGLFTTAAFLFYARSRHDHVARNTVLCLVAVVMACLSSPVALGAPILFIVYDFCRARAGMFAWFRVCWRHYALILAGCAVFSGLLMRSLLPLQGRGAVSARVFESPLTALFTMLRVLFDYMLNLIAPFQLNSRYVDYETLTPWNLKVFAISAVVIIIAFHIGRSLRLRRTFGFFCLSWFVVFWMPVSNLVPISTLMADRYLYLPAIGFFVAVSAGLAAVCERQIFRRHSGLVHVVIMGCVIGGLSIMTIERHRVWSNSVSLWRDSLDKNPENALAHNNLANALRAGGNAAAAVYHYRQALRIDPRHVKAWNNLGIALRDQGRDAEARDLFRHALVIEPDYVDARFNLALTVERLGDDDTAEAHYRHVLRLNPKHPYTHFNLGHIMNKRGQSNRAVAHYRQAVALKPDFAEAHNSLGTLLGKSGKVAEAEMHFERAVADDSDNVAYRANLAFAQTKRGLLDEAAANYRYILVLRPNNPAIHNRLGAIYYQRGQIQTAVDHFESAIRVDRTYRPALRNLETARRKLQTGEMQSSDDR